MLTHIPHCWDHNKVAEKIFEALSRAGNPVDIGYDGTKTFLGKTLEGIEIEIRLSKEGFLHTAFPVVAKVLL